MEVSNLSTLQDEVKLLKGEIKSVLKELRTALLSQDNPFSLEASPPAFRAVSRPDDGLATERPHDLAPERIIEERAPFAEHGEGSALAQRVPGLQREEHQQTAWTERARQDVAASRAEAEPPEPAHEWSLLTVAGLATWAEDALAQLGAKRYRVVLELATFGGIIAPDVRDVLRSLAELDEPEAQGTGHIKINDCLIVLRQLEAILSGERVTVLPGQRQRRRKRRP